MNRSDNILAILNITKCAGKTIQFNIRLNYKKNQYLILHHLENPQLKSRQSVLKFIKNIDKEKKDNIRYIAGPSIYAGIDKYFEKEIYYITFIRNPIHRTISHYNHYLELLKNREEPDYFKKYILRNNKILTFSEWLNISTRFNNFTCKYLITHLFKIKDISDYLRSVNINSLKMAKCDILDLFLENGGFELLQEKLKTFYFIGIVEDQNDFLFVYHLLKLKNIYPNIDVSKKSYFDLDNQSFTSEIIKKNKYDINLYFYVIQLNRHFKQKNLDNYFDTYHIALKKNISSRIKYIKYKKFLLIWHLMHTMKIILLKIKKILIKNN